MHYEMINGNELRVYYLDARDLQDVKARIIDCLWKQSSTDIELAYLGGIYQSDLETGRTFIEDGVDGLQMVFGKKYSNIYPLMLTMSTV
jgi:hypothetical protein